MVKIPLELVMAPHEIFIESLSLKTIVASSIGFLVSASKIFPVTV